MKSTTVASEKTRLFYVKLKRSPMADWFTPTFTHQRRVVKHKLPKAMLKSEFEITRFAYFHKHPWYFFSNGEVSGWLPMKNVRDNYRRIAVPALKSSGTAVVDDYLTVAMMLLDFAGSKVDAGTLNRYFTDSLNQVPTPGQFFNIVVQRVGTFKNLSNKKLRRLRSHIRRERPIMVWLGSKHDDSQTAVLLTGFNKKLFFYIEPMTGTTMMITKKELMKRWRAAGYYAISY